MPNPDDWYKKPHAKEIIYSLYDGNTLEKRIRIRFRTKQVGRSKRREVGIFTVGFEILYNGRWEDIVRHCNHHEGLPTEFHTHNDYSLICLGNEERIIQKGHKKKTPASQMRWAIKNIKVNVGIYTKQFLGITERSK